MFKGPLRSRLEDRGIGFGATGGGSVLEDGEGNQTSSNEPQPNTTDEDPIIEQAEKWWENISKEENKRKMMKNYLESITDLSSSEIEQKLDEAGL